MSQREFSTPPVREVAIATYFNAPISDFRNEYIGIFWEKIRKEFPNVQQVPPTGYPAGIGIDVAEDEIFPMPRYWFVSRDDTQLIQIEKNAFIFSWRAGQSSEYPGFDREIKPLHDRYYALFDEFVRQELKVAKLTIRYCELTYINIINESEYWTMPGDTNRVIPSFSIPNPCTEQALPMGFHCKYLYETQPNSALTIAIRSGITSESPETPILVVELEMSSMLEEGTRSEANEWLELAHGEINRCFMGITSRDVQREFWVPKG